MLRTMQEVVFITGASSGLGLALARLTPFPARVIDISRSGPPEGSDIDHLRHDLSDPTTWPLVSRQVREIVSDMRPTRSVFIHAAGTLTPIGFVSDVDLDAYTDNVLLNSAAGQVLGLSYLQAIKGLRGRHDLAMISSGAASSIYPGWSAYGAGKAALNQWVRNVGAEQKLRDGARVIAIAPGVVATPMQQQIRDTTIEDFPEVERFHELHQNDQLVDPEVAAAKLWEVLESDLETGSVVDLRDF